LVNITDVAINWCHKRNKIIDIFCCFHTIWLCFWSYHINNQRKCQFGDYGEETRWFPKTHS